MSRTSLLAKLIVMALAVLLVAESTSYAQRRGGRRGGFGFGGRGFGGVSKSMLLRSEQVQKELSISEDQQKKIDEIVTASRESSRELFSGFRGLRDLPEEEREKKMAEMREKMQAAAEELNGKISAELNESQNQRIEEIILQQRGVSAFADKEFAGKLKLSDEQQQTVKDLFAAQREMMQELFSGVRDLPREERREKFAELREKSEELRAESTKAVMEVLTAEQKAEYEKLQGAKFELDRESLRGGRRRGNRSRPQNN